MKRVYEGGGAGEAGTAETRSNTFISEKLNIYQY